ncbi:hypothetical protein MKO06_15610 [Gramella sp. GC03-9]|uniref:Uncharacterized protein n=1 Tax=Christiangramia oceanisediminis TaxID=2920386 RepID=A0A9X2L002_9FLAO|nr:hypothetical protein [Gramella oceanisediminis]MCP9201336.1 hypothetical protein [Gramella oceanisediminis]
MKEFLEQIFNKAERESGLKSLRGRCEYISESLLENFKYQLSYKSLERYYKNESSPKGETKDMLAKYLGYSDYNEFILNKHSGDNEKIEVESHKGPYAIKGFKQWILVSLIPLIGTAGYVGFLNGSEECMVWVEDHYEPIKCEGELGEVAYRSFLVKNFRQIEVSDTTTFFKNGEVQVWYDKYKNDLYYFTAPGINPENGKTLKPITNYMIDKYVLSESEK